MCCVVFHGWGHWGSLDETQRSTEEFWRETIRWPRLPAATCVEIATIRNSRKESPSFDWPVAPMGRDVTEGVGDVTAERWLAPRG